jgi:hypothetical protein
MGLHEYLMSQEVDRHDYPFYSLVMALVRRADTENLRKLRVAFPETVRETKRRYNAGQGLLREDLPKRGIVETSDSRSVNLNGVRGNFGKFEHQLICGTFFMPDGSERALFVRDPSDVVELDDTESGGVEAP